MIFLMSYDIVTKDHIGSLGIIEKFDNSRRLLPITYIFLNLLIFMGFLTYLDVLYSNEYDVCAITLSVYPHQTG